MKEFSEAHFVATHGFMQVPHRTLAEVEAKHRTNAFERAWQAPNRLPRGGLEGGAGLFQLGPTIDTLHFAELRKTRRHSDRVAGKRACLIDGAVRRELVHDFRTTAEGSNRQSTANHFPHRSKVGLNLKDLLRPTACEAKSGHHFIKNQNRSHLGTESSQCLQKSRLGQIQSRIRRHGLKNQGGDLAGIGLKGRANGIGVIIRNRDRESGQLRRHTGAIWMAMRERAAASFH